MDLNMKAKETKKEKLKVSLCGDAECLVEAGKTKLVLSYDEAYDLALSLASFIQGVGDPDDVSAHLH